MNDKFDKRNPVDSRAQLSEHRKHRRMLACQPRYLGIIVLEAMSKVQAAIRKHLGISKKILSSWSLCQDFNKILISS